MIRGLLLSLVILIVAGCMSTRVTLSPKWNPSLKPSYTDYMDYYILGFAGEPKVNLAQVCLDQKPLGFQRLKMPDDMILSVLTLGIYTPMTVRVWCGEP